MPQGGVIIIKSSGDVTEVWSIFGTLLIGPCRRAAFLKRSEG